VQGDFHPNRSDLDILGVVRGELSQPVRDRLARDLEEIAKALPVSGLELILCDESTAIRPPPEPPYVFALSTGPNWPFHREDGGVTTDLLIHFVLCRQAGLALVGPEATIVFGDVARGPFIRALLNEIAWFRSNAGNELHDPSGSQAVLNAARSVYAAESGTILSKTAGALWWLQRHPDDAIVANALELRSGTGTEALNLTLVLEFLARAEAEILVRL
jgi:streptomycin 3"-adenylyltransferase